MRAQRDEALAAPQSCRHRRCFFAKRREPDRAPADIGSAPAADEVVATEAAERKAEELDVDLSEVEGTGSEGQVVVEDVEDASGEEKATDAARRNAEELGVDLADVEGTGSGGRITVGDVENAAKKEDEKAG